MHTCMPGLVVQIYATYPSMPGALRALCPVIRGVTPGITRIRAIGPYARCHPSLFSKIQTRIWLSCLLPFPFYLRYSCTSVRHCANCQIPEFAKFNPSPPLVALNLTFGRIEFDNLASRTGFVSTLQSHCRPVAPARAAVSRSRSPGDGTLARRQRDAQLEVRAVSVTL